LNGISNVEGLIYALENDDRIEINRYSCTGSDMRSVVQRVKNAQVSIEGRISGSIGKGLLVFVGIEDEDSRTDADWLAAKIVNLRVFDDEAGLMNLSVRDIDADILVVSQFTLHASVRKGNRPSYSRASKPETAIPLYDYFTQRITHDLGKSIQTGVFGAIMEVSLLNDGPVTILIDTKSKE
jgi:D-tyrosyl-tRNA(Tyr) deacylase